MITRKIRAISVDDEPSNLLLIEAMAKSLDVNVVSYSSGKEALKAAQNEDFDFAFVDYNMPEIDGVTLLKEFRKIFPEIPIIMITAVQNESDLKLRAIEAGATEFMNKPLSLPEFKARVGNLLKLRRAHLLLEDRALLLEEEVKKATGSILRREYETLSILGRVSDFKDEETGAHISRVAYYSKFLAALAGLPKEQQEIIFYASPLHDIGKIGIPDNILRKPGALDDEELNIMRRHPAIGSMILKEAESRYLQAGEIISRTHHERWDGTGYPRRLKGEDIHIYGRIVGICDVFDALLSRRVYKEPWSKEDVLDYYNEQKGKQFDPRFAELLIGAFDEMYEIFLNNQDE